jgi:hypothetical protein
MSRQLMNSTLPVDMPEFCRFWQCLEPIALFVYENDQKSRTLTQMNEMFVIFTSEELEIFVWSNRVMNFEHELMNLF